MGWTKTHSSNVMVTQIYKLNETKHTVNQLKPTVNIKLLSKTCQNLLLVVELPLVLSKWLDWKDKIVDSWFHQRFYITLYNIFRFITTTLHDVLNKKRDQYNTSYLSIYINVDH